MKDKILLGIIWIIILLSAVYMIATNTRQTQLILNAKASERLSFGDALLETQDEMQIIYDRAEAIAYAEGYYKSGTLARKNNNPGNIKLSGYSRDNQGHSVFATSIQGWIELWGLLYRHKDESIVQMGRWYATDKNWARNVLSRMKQLTT